MRYSLALEVLISSTLRASSLSAVKKILRVQRNTVVSPYLLLDMYASVALIPLHVP